ncbi:YqzE family protein [Ornithinibacillus gellani]|uniref:YqzE family protein n=1 Tax=Ornithinibacillus gellani TaxID=2293253 RepID=UPI001CC1F668|nr:YqzE family protein [Ornithinibacillus gellani]
MGISGNEYVKFLTQQIVTYLDMSQEEKEKRKKPKLEHTYRWFGMLSFSVQLMRQKKQLRP